MYGQRGGHRQKREIGARRVHELREKEGVLSKPHQHVLWEACVCVGGGAGFCLHGLHGNELRELDGI